MQFKDKEKKKKIYFFFRTQNKLEHRTALYIPFAISEENSDTYHPYESGTQRQDLEIKFLM